MEKLLFVPDNHSLHNGAVDFACYLAKMTGSVLTGVFPESLRHKELTTTTMDKDIMYIHTVTTTDLPENEPVRAHFGHLVDQFKQACTLRETTCTIHRDHGAPLQDLILESRFADALIIESSLTYTIAAEDGSLSSHATRLLAGAECPVIIAPPHFQQIDELVFAYDGSAASVNALKLFIYLFPELKDRKVVIIEVHNEEVSDTSAKAKMMLEEWLEAHFQQHKFIEMEGDPESRLLAYTMNCRHVFIIMGAYGRSGISRFFKSSTAQSILEVVPSPVFIAHH